MTLLQALLRATNFRSPLLRTVVPCVSAAFAIQAAVAVPSILAQSDRFYDFSGAVTHLTVAALSLYLPALRARAAATSGVGTGLPSLLAPFTNPGGALLNWRQVVLTTAVSIWAARLGSYLFQRVLREGKDSRFDKIKTSPLSFLGAFTGQAVWVSLCMLPVMALNAVPATAFAALPAAVRLTDALGLALFAGGLGFEVAADRQKDRWLREKRAKTHDEEFITRGLWSRSRFPNYFGETTLWTGVAIFAAGVLVTRPAQAAVGLGGGLLGRAAVVSMASAAPAFTAFVLLKVTGAPLSERKYDKRYGHRRDYQEWKNNTPKFFPKVF